MSTLNVTALKHESAGVDNLVLDTSGNATFGGIAKVGSLMHPSGSGSAIAMDSAGRVTMPYQPGFKASGLSTQNTDTSGVTDYKFNNTSAARGYNTGNHYNTTTGRFTAPVNGVYLFSVNVMGDGTSDRFMIRLKLNGSDVHQGSSSSQANQYQDSKITATLNLVAGDYISVGCWGAKLNYGGNGALEMWFCGHLIG